MLYRIAQIVFLVLLVLRLASVEGVSWVAVFLFPALIVAVPYALVSAFLAFWYFTRRRRRER